jgi:hypothetical protein
MPRISSSTAAMTSAPSSICNLPADHLKLFRTERAAMQEFGWHVGPTRDLGRLFLGRTAPLRNRASWPRPG